MIEPSERFKSGRLWSLWDMYNFKIKPLIDAQDVLSQCTYMMANKHRDMHPVVNNGIRENIVALIENLEIELPPERFEFCRKSLGRLRETVVKSSQTAPILEHLQDLRVRLLDECEMIFCVSLDDSEKALFEQQSPLFGDNVEAKMNAASEDISEAGKCLALNRPTASVFHLMRVMERAVQMFGDMMGIPLANEQNWQNILDQINKKIKFLDHKQKQTKTFAEISNQLYAVKIAWRNEVMHPKQTYTVDEAREIFRHTEIFVKQLAAVV
jgi:hypothetical protein